MLALPPPGRDALPGQLHLEDRIGPVGKDDCHHTQLLTRLQQGRQAGRQAVAEVPRRLMQGCSSIRGLLDLCCDNECRHHLAAGWVLPSSPSPPASRGPADCTCRCHPPAGGRQAANSVSTAPLPAGRSHTHTTSGRPPTCRLMTARSGQATAAPTASGMPAPMAPPAHRATGQEEQVWQC